MRVPERIVLRRVVAAPDALDAAGWPAAATVLRVARDEAIVLGDGPLAVADPHAIVEDDAGFAALALSPAEADELLARHAAWAAPRERPALAQGALAGLPVRLHLDRGAALLLVPAPFAAELAERIG